VLPQSSCTNSQSVSGVQVAISGPRWGWGGGTGSGSVADPDPHPFGKLPPFHFDADPDLAFQFDAEPDPAFHFDSDPDPHQSEEVEALERQLFAAYLFRNST
jgi:hypothetical protein